jgi:hypothetical protein
MGALYKGLIATGVLSLLGLAGDHWLIGWGTLAAADYHRHGAVLVRRGRPRRHRPDHLDHRILHRHRLSPGEVDRAGVGHRSRHQRDPGPRDLDGIDRAAGHRHHRGHLITYSSPACSASRSRPRPCSRSPA